MYVLLFNMVGIGQFFTISFDEKKGVSVCYFLYSNILNCFPSINRYY